MSSDQYWTTSEYNYSFTTYDYLHSGVRTTFWPIRHKMISTPGFYMTPKIDRQDDERVYIKHPLLYLLPLLCAYLIVALFLTYCFGHLFKAENCFHPKMNFIFTCLLMQCCCFCPQLASRIIAPKYACRNKCEETCDDKCQETVHIDCDCSSEEDLCC